MSNTTPAHLAIQQATLIKQLLADKAALQKANEYLMTEVLKLQAQLAAVQATNATT